MFLQSVLLPSFYAIHRSQAEHHLRWGIIIVLFSMAMTKYVCCFFRIRIRLSCSIGKCFLYFMFFNRLDFQRIWFVIMNVFVGSFDLLFHPLIFCNMIL
ncbi:hypothetical protein Hanom_Chr02g00172571 [Helianthus anomalus]